MMSINFTFVSGVIKTGLVCRMRVVCSLKDSTDIRFNISKASIKKKPLGLPPIRDLVAPSETPVVPNIDLNETLRAFNEAMEGGFETYAKIIHSFRFAPKLVEGRKSAEEEKEEEESSFYVATPSSVENELGEISSSSTVAINLDRTQTERVPTTIEEVSVLAEISDSEMIWQPTGGRDMASFTLKIPAEMEETEEADESALAKRLIEEYGGALQQDRSSLIRKAQELVEKKTPFDTAELSSLKR